MSADTRPSSHPQSELGPSDLSSFEALVHDAAISPIRRGAVAHLLEQAGWERPILRPENTLKLLTRTRRLCDGETAEENYVSPRKFKESKSLPRIFSRAVERLGVEECAFPLPGRNLPTRFDRYRLVPLTLSPHVHSYEPAGSGFSCPEDVAIDNGGRAKRVYLDTSLAIGLAYKGVLRAVAGAHLNASVNHIDIVQLQGIAGTHTGTQSRYKSGLYGGFDWRATLVRAWAQVAPMCGPETISLDSAINHFWLTAHNFPQLLEGYDQIGQRMGLEVSDGTGNWLAKSEKVVAQTAPVA